MNDGFARGRFESSRSGAHQEDVATASDGLLLHLALHKAVHGRGAKFLEPYGQRSVFLGEA